ncbi:MAG: cell wall-active antibiotics response protein [bacterium]|nr:cell wall-active antibiotics response protein [bacterium]MDN5835383.1 cell wall-active antibiotics response protein [bacterium]
MNKNISRYILGGVIVLFGAAVFANNINVLDLQDTFEQWWPLLIILGAVLILINDTKNYIWAIVVAGFGLLMQLDALDYIDVEPWQVIWPLVLVVIGLSIVTNRSGDKSKINKDSQGDVSAILGGADQRSASEDFKSTNVTAIMGGAKLDLRRATIKQSATVNVSVIMGGIELVVPRNVVIQNKTSAILGGSENQTDQDTSKSSPVLTIVGSVVLGGIEIKN